MDKVNDVISKIIILKSSVETAGKQYVDESDLEWLEQAESYLMEYASQLSISVEKLLHPNETANKKAKDFVSDISYLGTEDGTETYGVTLEGLDSISS